MAKIESKILEALNEQLNKEIYSMYLYLSMAAYLEKENWKGMAHWMKAQANEEFGHAMKIYDYIYQRGGSVIFKEIKQPPYNFNSIEEVWQMIYNHEKGVTESIKNLMKLAREENDYATEVELNWFIKEQVEEEASALEILEYIKKASSHINALFMIDSKLGSRK
jgi:ferritin